MKKTIIALMALAGVAAAAETVTLAPLTETEGWSHISLRDRATWTQDATAGTLTLNNSNWGQAVSTYNLATDLGGELTFSVDIARGSVSAGFSFVLIGTEKALTLGTKDYTNGTLFYGVSDNVSADSYYLNTAWDKGIAVGSTELLSAAFNYNSVTSLTGTTSVDDNGDTILTLTAASTSASGDATATINLGKDFVLDKIMLCGDGDNNASGIWTVSNLSVTGTPVVPEPATATLSLLALAGLAARRRRK